jgi:prevent-host-death family protein
MNTLNVSIAEGERNFTKIIRASEEKRQKIIVSRRGTPVAFILPYDEYNKSRKKEVLKKIKEARAIYRKSGISAEEIYQISKKELEGNPTTILNALWQDHGCASSCVTDKRDGSEPVSKRSARAGFQKCAVSLAA